LCPHCGQLMQVEIIPEHFHRLNIQKSEPVSGDKF
jgi:hypothetical protein